MIYAVPNEIWDTLLAGIQVAPTESGSQRVSLRTKPLPVKVVPNENGWISASNVFQIASNPHHTAFMTEQINPALDHAVLFVVALLLDGFNSHRCRRWIHLLVKL